MSDKEKYKFVVRGWAPWVHPTSLFVRDYLLEKGEAYPYEIYKALVEKRRQLELHVCSPQSFYEQFSVMRRLGLVEKTGKIVKSFRAEKFWRTFYRITPGMEERLDLWRYPRRALYEKLLTSHVDFSKSKRER